MDNFNDILYQEFYNTICLNNEQWKEENEKAKGLQDLIKFICSQNNKVMVSGWLMKRYLEKVQGHYINLNSVRRCLSNLKNTDVLLILTSTRMGEEKKSEHYYIWKIGNEGRVEYQNRKI